MSATRIGIIGAMESEVSHLKGRITESQTETISGMEFCSGKLGAVEVVVVKCGIGKVNAATCAQTLALHYGVTQIINTGVAGSLDAHIGIGDLVVSTDAVQHDVDIVALGYPLGMISGMKSLAFEADSDLRAATCAIAREVAPEVQVHEGRIASGDQFVTTTDQRDHIVQTFGALCCEMEGASIAQVATLSDIPFVIIRAISDNADETSTLDYPTFEKRAARISAHIVEALVARMQPSS